MGPSHCAAQARTGWQFAVGFLFAGMILAIAIPSCQEGTETKAKREHAEMERKGKVDRARIDVKLLSDTVEAYKASTGEYPPDLKYERQLWQTGQFAKDGPETPQQAALRPHHDNTTTWEMICQENLTRSTS